MNSWMLPNLSKKQKIGFLSSFSCLCTMSWNMEKKYHFSFKQSPLFFIVKMASLIVLRRGKGQLFFILNFEMAKLVFWKCQKVCIFGWLGKFEINIFKKSSLQVSFRTLYNFFYAINVLSSNKDFFPCSSSLWFLLLL